MRLTHHIGGHERIRIPDKAFTGGAAPVGGYSAAVLADNPLLYWRLGEASGTTAADTSGNARTGTYGAGITLGAAGATTDGNTAASFNDSGTAIITSAYAPFVAGSQRTFEAWVSRTSTTSTDGILSGTGANPPVLECAPGSGDINWWPDGAHNLTWAAAMPGTGTYVHVALTWDDSTKTAELFINGASQGTRTGAFAYGVAPGNYQAGRGTGPWLGLQDEHAIYGSLLSSARISAHVAAR